MRFHLSSIYQKLKVANGTEAARWAQLRGLDASAGDAVAMSGWSSRRSRRPIPRRRMPIALSTALESTEVFDHRADTFAFSEPVSPELALIDPELARRERATLWEPAAFRPAMRTVLRATALYDPPARVRMRGAQRAQGNPAPPAPGPDPARESSLQDFSRTATSQIAALLGALRPRRGSVAAVAAALAVGGGLLLTLQERPAWQIQKAVPEAASHAGTRSPARRLPAKPLPVTSLPATPSAEQARPATHAQVIPTGDVKTLVWAPVEGALGYEVQLFLGSERVLVKRTRAPRLGLRTAWQYEGRTVRRKNGTYRWYVWPLLTRNQRGSKAIVQARMVIASGA